MKFRYAIAETRSKLFLKYSKKIEGGSVGKFELTSDILEAEKFDSIAEIYHFSEKQLSKTNQEFTIIRIPVEVDLGLVSALTREPEKLK